VRAPRVRAARRGNRAVPDTDGRVLDRILLELRADGISVSDDFLASCDVHALAECATSRRARGDFAEARIGAERSLQRREDIRGDRICWLAEAAFPAEALLLRSLERLRLRLNEGAYLGLLDLEIHYAWYPPGAAYSLHVDRPLGSAGRRVSLVLYLNEQWSAANGGALRIRADDGRFRDIEPLGGRLVLFLSESREHEVLVTKAPRLSLTGWFRGRE
jgi:SM-20-related protein